jgi:hypothetical protein
MSTITGSWPAAEISVGNATIVTNRRPRHPVLVRRLRLAARLPLDYPGDSKNGYDSALIETMTGSAIYGPGHFSMAKELSESTANLITNSQFATDIADWNQVGASLLARVDGGYFSSGALHVQGMLADTYAAVQTETLAVSPSYVDGLIHYWSMDETSGNRVDSVGDLDLAPINSPGYTAGKVGNACDMEADSTQYLDAGTTLDLRGTFSLVLWFKEESVASAYAHTIFTTGGSSGGGGLVLAIQTNHVVMAVLHKGDDTTNVWLDGFSADIGNWVLVAVTHNADSKALVLYIGSGGSCGVADSDTYAFTSTTPVVNVQIGNGTGWETWDGLIDEVGLWSRILTADEITWLYNSGSGRSYTEIVESS